MPTLECRVHMIGQATAYMVGKQLTPINWRRNARGTPQLGYLLSGIATHAAERVGIT
jgi:hypothetical protein